LPYAVDRGDITSVGDRVAALDRAPGVQLPAAVHRFFLGVPADGGRIEQHGRALQRREARALGIPLVPAHQGSDPSHPRVERAETQVPRGEVKLLVVGGIIGDRKSTRLNSSHDQTSYAVFCLKKKTS